MLSDRKLHEVSCPPLKSLCEYEIICTFLFAENEQVEALDLLDNVEIHQMIRVKKMKWLEANAPNAQ